MRVPGWVCRGVVSITDFSNVHVWRAKPATYQKPKQFFFFLPFRHIYRRPRGSWLIKKIKYNNILTVVIRCPQRYLAALSAGRHRPVDWGSDSLRNCLLIIQTCLCMFLSKKSRIRETQTLSTDADSRTDTNLMNFYPPLHSGPIQGVRSA